MKKENIHRALEIGSKILGQKGYHGLGLREFLENAGIPSGSFYYYFKSKEDFAAKVIEHYGEKVANYFNHLLFDNSKPFNNRLEIVFNEEIERINQTAFTEGCMIGDLTSEIAGQNTLIQNISDTNYNRWQDIFERFFNEGQKEGSFSKSFNAKEMAIFFLSSRQGALTRVKASRTIEPYKLFQFYMTNLILN